MNLISGTHNSCERMEYAFMVLQEYTIISPTDHNNYPKSAVTELNENPKVSVDGFPHMALSCVFSQSGLT